MLRLSQSKKSIAIELAPWHLPLNNRHSLIALPRHASQLLRHGSRFQSSSISSDYDVVSSLKLQMRCKSQRGREVHLNIVER